MIVWSHLGLRFKRVLHIYNACARGACYRNKMHIYVYQAGSLCITGTAGIPSTMLCYLSLEMWIDKSII